MFKEVCEKLDGKGFICTFVSVHSGVVNFYLLTEMKGRDSCLRECSLGYFFYHSSLLSKSMVLAKVVQKQLLL